MSLDELITVESPNKAKKWLEYCGIKTIATAGHFMGLPKNEMGVDMATYLPKFVIEKKDVYERLKKEAKGKIVYIAADEDREGEAIGFMTYQVIKNVAKEVYRIRVNEITKDRIKKAFGEKVLFSSLGKSSYDAFLGRRISDRLIGYLLSPLANRVLNSGLEKKDGSIYSVGRVQTVGVKLIYDREMEIRAFISEPFYTLSAFIDINGLEVELKHTTERFTDKDYVNSLSDSLRSLDAVVESVKMGAVATTVVPPYTTSTLQQDASSRLGFDVKRTMDLAQHLFEDGRITYHRTDQCKLNDDFNMSLRDYIADKYGVENVPASMVRHTSKNSQADAHEGIRPTDIDFNGDSLSGDERALYDLIKSRTIASQMINPVIKGTVVTFDIGGEKFIVKSQMIEKEGYLQVYKRGGKKNEILLPPLNEGDSFAVESLKVGASKTEPSKRYSEASLVAKLESDGIGRPSTYATIVDTIQKRGYVIQKGDKKVKVFHLLDKGESLINYVRDEKLASWILDFGFTAYLEDELDRVEKGLKNHKEVIKEVHSKMDFRVETADIGRTFVDNVSCPICGGEIEEIDSAFRCANFKYNKSTGVSEGCQFFVFKNLLGLCVENLDGLFNGDIFEVDGEYGLKNYVFDLNAVKACRNGAKLKPKQSLIIVKKDIIDGLLCPKCGGGMTESENQFSCENAKMVKKGAKFVHIGSCDFKVNKKNDFVGYLLDEDMLNSLIRDREMKIDNGKIIKLDLENPYFIVDKAYAEKESSQKSTGLLCPVCKSDIIENDKVFGCSKKKKKSCKFVVFKDNPYKNFTIDINRFKALLGGTVIDIEDDRRLEMDLSGDKGFLKIV